MLKWSNENLSKIFVVNRQMPYALSSDFRNKFTNLNSTSNDKIRKLAHVVLIVVVK